MDGLEELVSQWLEIIGESSGYASPIKPTGLRQEIACLFRALVGPETLHAYTDRGEESGTMGRITALASFHNRLVRLDFPYRTDTGTDFVQPGDVSVCEGRIASLKAVGARVDHDGSRPSSVEALGSKSFVLRLALPPELCLGSEEEWHEFDLSRLPPRSRRNAYQAWRGVLEIAAKAG